MQRYINSLLVSLDPEIAQTNILYVYTLMKAKISPLTRYKTIKESSI